MIKAEEKEMLEDLIMAAVNDGMRKAREMASTRNEQDYRGIENSRLMPDLSDH